MQKRSTPRTPKLSPPKSHTLPITTITCSAVGEGGIGLSFAFTPLEGLWIVKSLTAAESADLNGQIKTGDALVSISSIDIRRCSSETVRDMIMGDPGTPVRIGLERTDSVTGRIFFYEVDLKRTKLGQGDEVPRRVLPQRIGTPSLSNEGVMSAAGTEPTAIFQNTYCQSPSAREVRTPSAAN
jgi:hypothetical protein